ncbi:MAG: response regulator [Anaerolineales bacterium]|nr:response regulator [Anaerolineales bacterium]
MQPRAPTVLIVDDDPAFCVIMREFLGGDGFEVHLAFDVPQALSFLAFVTPDLILSDIMMPEIDGLWLVRSLRSAPSTSNIPTIVISAKAMPEDRIAAIEAGADAFVSKPFSMVELRQVISEFLPTALH